jgi:galactokinase
MRVTWRAPGRVNLIGEHTDYNDGFALPFALEQSCTASLEISTDRALTIRSAQRPDAVHVPLDQLAPGTGDWAGYVCGVVYALQRREITIPGLSISVASDVPVGGGLSSSAALTCAVATALDDLLGLGLGADELLAVTRSAENDYVGAPTGGMDQLAALRCVVGHVLLCDMRALETEQVPFDPAASGLSMLVVDTRAPHQHAGGEYGARREGCARAAGILGVTTLREVTCLDLDAALSRLPDDAMRRYTRHVVTENERVLETAALLRAGRLPEIGQLLTDSHRSMRDDYRITVPELDVAVETLIAAGALGARMTGGGFGGSVVALIAADRVEPAAAAVRAAFATQRFASPTWFTARPSRGAHRV